MGSIALSGGRWAAVPRPVVWAVVTAGVVLALVAEGLRLRAGWPLSWVLVDVVPGLAFLGCGLVAVLRRPDTVMGPLMIATGFAWYAGTVAASMNPLVDRIGNAFQGYYDGLLSWLVLAYPTGRLAGRAARLTIATIFATLFARTIFRFATFAVNTDYDLSIPAEVERWIANQSLRQTGEASFQILLVGLIGIVLVLLLRRLWTESALARRIAWPMVLAGVALGVGVGAKALTLRLASNPAERFEAWAIGDVLTAATGSAVAVAFVIGLVRGRLARQSVADLVLDLDRSGERPALRQVVARALRDPSLELLYPDVGGYIDAEGTPRELADAVLGDRAITRIESGGTVVAVLVHDPAIADQPELMRSVIAAVRLAIENERLAAEVRAQLAEVRASRARIVAAGDEQRKRVERDLHDGAQQRLVTLALRLQVARAAAQPADPELAEALDAAARDLDAAIVELRELARGLHPSILASDGLQSAVEALAERTPLEVAVDVVDRRFHETVESTTYFVVAEALTNVVRHSGAHRAAVTVGLDSGLLITEVSDDGAGGAALSEGSGLRGLEDRVAAAGGSLTVSSPPGGGTTIRAEIPCA